MSSQGSNSVRVYSGAAFVAMASDPLSREVSMPSASSMESIPEVTSCPANKGDTRPAHETTSTSSHFSEEKEEDEVAVSCEDLQFVLTVEDFV